MTKLKEKTNVVKPENETQTCFNPKSGNALMEMELPDISEVVPGLLVEGLTVVAGKPKLGKSWLMLNVGFSVANGAKALGSIETEQKGVLYLALEDNFRRLQSRFDLMLKENEKIPDLFHYEISIPRHAEGGLKILSDYLGKNKHIKLVVIDTLVRFRSTSGRSTDAYQVDSQLGADLQEIAHKHGIALVVVHHQRKAAAEDWLDSISGSLGLVGSADSIIVLDRKREEAFATLRVTGRDLEDVEYPVEFNPSMGAWFLTKAEKAKVSENKMRKQIVEFLSTQQLPIAPKVIAEQTGLKDSTVRSHLRRMKQKNEVVCNEANGYFLPRS